MLCGKEGWEREERELLYMSVMKSMWMGGITSVTSHEGLMFIA